MSVRVYHITVVEQHDPVSIPDVQDELQVDYVQRQTLIRSHIAREQCLLHLVRYVQQQELQREQEQRNLQREQWKQYFQDFHRPSKRNRVINGYQSEWIEEKWTGKRKFYEM
jgi:hypothetical protein